MRCLLYCLLFINIVYAGRPSGFTQFIENENAMNLIKQYQEKIIKNMDELLAKLNDAGIEISKRTLNTYLSNIKVNCQKNKILIYTFFNKEE